MAWRGARYAVEYRSPGHGTNAKAESLVPDRDRRRGSTLVRSRSDARTHVQDRVEAHSARAANRITEPRYKT